MTSVYLMYQIKKKGGFKENMDQHSVWQRASIECAIVGVTSRQRSMTQFSEEKGSKRVGYMVMLMVNCRHVPINAHMGKRRDGRVVLDAIGEWACEY